MSRNSDDDDDDDDDAHHEHSAADQAGQEVDNEDRKVDEDAFVAPRKIVVSATSSLTFRGD